jgi:hypothetical protein
MLPEKVLALGVRKQMNKKTYAMITVIFLSWAFILLVIKNNYHTKDYITPEEESALTFIK